MVREQSSRRDFIGDLGKTMATIVIAGAATGLRIEAAATSKIVPMGPITLDLTKPENATLKSAGGALKVPDPNNRKRPIIICRTSDSTVAAYSSKCTHWGCELPLPVNGTFICPCHDSKFDLNGKVTHGPAKRGLAPFSASLDGDKITIKDLS